MERNNDESADPNNLPFVAEVQKQIYLQSASDVDETEAKSFTEIGYNICEEMRNIQVSNSTSQDMKKLGINVKEISFDLGAKNYGEAFGEHLLETMDCDGDEIMLGEFRAVVRKSKEFSSLVDDISTALKMAKSDAKCIADQVVSRQPYKISCNAEGSFERCRDVIAMHAADVNVVTHQCLMLSAPTSITFYEDHIGRKIFLNEKEDAIKRVEEMESFSSTARFSSTNDIESAGLYIWYHVYSAEDVKEKIREFFCNRQLVSAKTGLHALIMFFGHGTCDGSFVLKNDYMNLDGIVEYVTNQWQDALPTEKLHLPASISIIYTQCYGHVRSDPTFLRDTKRRVRVVSLTRLGNNEENTLSKENWKTGKWENSTLMEGATGKRELDRIEKNCSERDIVRDSITSRNEFEK